MNDEEIVCTCMGVTVGAIKEAFRNGAHSVADIQNATGAGTVCGACLGEIELLLNQLSAVR